MFFVEFFSVAVANIVSQLKCDIANWFGRLHGFVFETFVYLFLGTESFIFVMKFNFQTTFYWNKILIGDLKTFQVCSRILFENIFKLLVYLKPIDLLLVKFQLGQYNSWHLRLKISGLHIP